MKNLVYIAYTFPPVSTGSAPMNLKVTSLLVNHGWIPTVVTPQHAGGLPMDESLLDLLPEEVRVIRDGRVRVGSLKASGGSITQEKRFRVPGRLRHFILKVLLQPDRYVAWAPRAIRASLKAIRESNADLIVTLGPPHSVHLVGLVCSALTGRPWVAYFGDLWVYDGYVNRDGEPRARRFWTGTMERWVVRAADGIVTTTDGSSEYFRKTYGTLCPPVQTLWNGATREETETLWSTQPPPALGNEMVVTYAGYLMGNQTPLYFMQGMKLFMQRHPERRIRFRVVGDPGGYTGLPGELGISEHVEWIGRVPFTSVREWQDLSHLLLILMPPQPGNELKNASKTVECLLARRPILALSREGDMTSLIRRMNAGYVSGHDAEGICHALETAWEEMSRGELRVLPSPDVLLGTEMDMEAGAFGLVQFLEGLCRRERTS